MTSVLLLGRVVMFITSQGSLNWISAVVINACIISLMCACLFTSIIVKCHWSFFISVLHATMHSLKQWRHDFVTLWIIRKMLLRKCIRMPDIGWLTGCDLDNDDQLNMYWAKCWLYAEHLFTFVSTLLDWEGWVGGVGGGGGGGVLTHKLTPPPQTG